MNIGIWWATTAAIGASVSVSPGDDLGTLTASLLAGDVVLFAAGTYPLPGTIVWSGQGTAAEPITLRAQDDGLVVLQNTAGGYVAEVSGSSHVILQNLVLEGDENAEYNGVSGLRVADSSNITVQNITVRNIWGTALRLDGNMSDITVRNNHLFGTGDGSGINVGCGDASCWLQSSVIEFNHLHDLQGTGVYLNPGTQGVTVQHNVVYRVRDDGMFVGDTQFGPQNIIFGNAIWEAEDDGIQLEGAALVQNNLVFEVGDNGIFSRNNDNEGLYDLRISHNTVARTDGHAAYLEDWFGRDGLVFANNALSNPTGYGLYWEDEMADPDYGTTVDTGNYISNNVVTGLVEGFDRLVRPNMVIPGGGVGDFEDLDNFDFYPTPTSVLRDLGDPSGEAYLPASDFNGTARDGASPDVGAYEFDGSDNPGWVVQEDFKELGSSGRTGGAIVSTGCCTNSGGGATQALIFLPLLSLGFIARRRV